MEPATMRLAEYERLKALGADKVKEKKWAEAIKRFNEAASVIHSERDTDPTRQGYYVICKFNAAQCCMNFDNYKGAIMYTEALSIDPKHKKALYRRGTSHLKLYQGERALCDFQSMLQLDPGNKEATEQVKKVADMREQVLKTVFSNNIKAITKLLDIGADVNIRGSFGIFPLHIASQNGYVKVVELLLSKGASVSDKDDKNIEGITPLYIASKHVHIDIISLLLSPTYTVVQLMARLV